MLNTNDPETFWLLTTNIILGLVVLACIIIVTRGVYQEILDRFRKRSSLPLTANRAQVIPLVGTTMADGGEPVNSEVPGPGQQWEPDYGSSRVPHTGK